MGLYASVGLFFRSMNHFSRIPKLVVDSFDANLKLAGKLSKSSIYLSKAPKLVSLQGFSNHHMTPSNQPRISSFFKPSASSAKPKPPVPACDEEEDELAIWEKAQHNFFNTYHRRTKQSDGDEVLEDLANKSTALENEELRPEPASTGKILNKKRSYAQFHLELGQSDFLLRTCSTCGCKYAPGDEGDEKNHNSFHKSYSRGVPFKGWRNERVIHMPGLQSGRVVLVLDGDPAPQRNKVQEVVKMMEIELSESWVFAKHCKVYLFISQQRVVGCLVAEPTKEAFKVLSCSGGKQCGNHIAVSTARPTPVALKFGQILFQREAIKRAHSAKCSNELDASYNGALICEEAPVTVSCGIRAVWVTPSNRRKGIATHILEAVRNNFCTGLILEKSQIAFSQPTSAGKALASSYLGNRSFLVYKPDHLGS